MWAVYSFYCFLADYEPFLGISPIQEIVSVAVQPILTDIPKKTPAKKSKKDSVPTSGVKRSNTEVSSTKKKSKPSETSETPFKPTLQSNSLSNTVESFNKPNITPSRDESSSSSQDLPLLMKKLFDEFWAMKFENISDPDSKTEVLKAFRSAIDAKNCKSFGLANYAEKACSLVTIKVRIILLLLYL